tara:strand:+ start:3878 stop:4063 length:186 start_codon:yes stop_codon:yes gene_type:complete
MEESVYQNWVKLKEKFEDQGANCTQSKFYNRICKCVETREDPGIPGYDEYYYKFLELYNIV